jgi:oxygen-dependent protoporphyrinogen oxidase
LIAALIRSLEGVTVLTRARVRAVSLRPGREIELESGRKIPVDAVCLAVPAYEAARLVSRQAPRLSDLLEDIAYESVATVNLAWNREDIRHPLDGFGYVVPAMEGLKITACTFSSVKFPHRAPDGKVLLRVFAGGAMNPDVFRFDDRALVDLAVREVSTRLGISKPPLFSVLSRYPHSMPQFETGHVENMRLLEEERQRHEGLFLTGNAYEGIGIPDCIARAERVAESILHPEGERSCPSITCSCSDTADRAGDPKSGRS